MGSMTSMVSIVTIRVCIGFGVFHVSIEDASGQENAPDDKTTFLLHLFESVFRKALVIHSPADLYFRPRAAIMLSLFQDPYSLRTVVERSNIVS